jgi:uncharacterized membrane protein
VNTPAHLILNLAVLGTGGRRRFAGSILAGALLPDLPIFVFYAWQRIAAGASEGAIWSHLYFDKAWQGFFDLFNSVPIALLGLLLAWRARRRALQLFFASWLLHCLWDLPFHREDAHRHFYPFSDWRFQSPVSYWDPAHHGALFALLETVLVLAGSFLLWRRFQNRIGRAALAVASGVYLTVYAVFYAGRIV